MPRPSASANTDLLTRLDERMKNLLEQVAEFRREYKEQTTQIRERQDEQFAVVMKRIQDIETWRATEIQPTRIMGWDQAAKRVDDFLDEKHVIRRERVFHAVEDHMDRDGTIESLVWLSRMRDRWGFIFFLGGSLLGIIGTLFFWLLNNVIVPMMNNLGGR